MYESTYLLGIYKYDERAYQQRQPTPQESQEVILPRGCIVLKSRGISTRNI